ncbi:GTPase ObgE [Ileibacterium valens]|uniref:GTPase Obg n=2 Tax=Ileibacterium valens TaxID=1862668 RepID=A0A1U7NEM8_9FIRM|nr:GTPase ObgE [Ileibacterium valens]OLU38112.1 GTPase ObgE [Ileibacterium valens]OLU38743.1 GTPase ObgE [Erysipelotrichaceae bacterium NYU-BL-F16]OLU40914.1 GTPase ObgE [Erysipelotrichaceae bacterium NYU-BL-E8]
MFVDQVKVHLKAGKGGDGLVSFKHEKYVANGGPFGGDGGHGGNIIFEADPGMVTLLDLRYHRIIRAEPGEKGKNKRMHGATAPDTVIKVPLGTMIKKADTGQIIADLTEPGQRQIVAQGGRGGRGNSRFKSSRNTVPRYAEPGREGEEFDAIVELRTLADVGLVGFPSVGKSTLLEAVTKAKPEIGDYPFTTISPNVGVVQTKDGRSFVMADLPGLIEGASQGKGLGHQFLKHIERCRVIVHVIDMGGSEGRDPVEDYRIINQELENYHLRLLDRPQIVVANKMDLEEAQENLKRFKEAYPDLEVFETTTIIHEGLDPVLRKAADLLAVTPLFPLTDEKEEDEGVTYTFEEKEKPYTIVRHEDGVYEVTGRIIDEQFHPEKLTTDEDYFRFANQMRYLGIDKNLRAAGAKDGDTIMLQGYEFEFVEQ